MLNYPKSGVTNCQLFPRNARTEWGPCTKDTWYVVFRARVAIELSRRYHYNHRRLTDIQPTRSRRLTLSFYTITDLTPRLDDQYWTVSHATRIPKLSIVIVDLTIVGTVPTITPCAYCRLRIITLSPRDELNVTRRSDTSSERVTDTR